MPFLPPIRIQCRTQTKQFFDLTGQSHQEPKVHYLLGLELTATKKRTQQLEILLKAALRAKNHRQAARLSYSLASIYQNQKQYRAQIEKLTLMMETTALLNDRDGIVMAINRIGCAYQVLQQFQQALQFHRKGWELSEGQARTTQIINQAICLVRLNRKAQSLMKLNEAAQQPAIQAVRALIAAQCEGPVEQKVNQLRKALQYKSSYSFKQQGFQKLALLSKQTSRKSSYLAKCLEQAHLSGQARSIQRAKAKFGISEGQNILERRERARSKNQ